MKYAKPEIVLLASALSIIQGTSKGQDQPDNVQQTQFTDGPAYEVDE